MSPVRALSVQANAPLVVDCLKCRFGVTWEQSQQKWQPHYAVVITQRADSGILSRLHSCIKWEKERDCFPHHAWEKKRDAHLYRCACTFREREW